MKRVPLNHGWTLTYGDGEWFQEKEQRQVDLPHDFVIGLPRRADNPGRSGNGYFGDGRGEYERTLTITPQQAEDAFWLTVDGAYMNAEVYLDRDQLAYHPYGYTPFHVELTGRLQPGKQHRLRIITQARQPATRWYSGGGLYREVSLWTGPRAFIAPWQVFAWTIRASRERAVLGIQLEPDHAPEGEVLLQLYAQDGSLAAEAGIPGAKRMTAELTVDHPQLWDTEEPCLYQLKITLPSGDVHTQQLAYARLNWMRPTASA